MKKSPNALLRALQGIQGEFGDGLAARKLELIAALSSCRLPRASDILAWHESLLFLRAYPDDQQVLDAVERALGGFHRRRDLRAVRAELENSGVFGTEIRFPCWWVMAEWLCSRWPGQVSIDWDAFEHADWLLRIVHLLVPYSESPALDEFDQTPRDWLKRLKRGDETDAAFLVRRFAALPVDEFCRETLYDNFDVPLRISPAPGTPSRTLDRWTGAAVSCQDRPLDRRRPDLRQDVAIPPHDVRVLSPKEGRRLIELARGAMLTRNRDLDAFANADPHDARIVDCGDGLAFGMLGLRPERRLMLESSYGLLTLKNGLPVGYVLISALFGSAAIAYNVFEAFRGGEAAKVLGRVLAVARHLFGVDAFSIDPYQLGHHNDEGLRSGAWWFYHKLGFRPVDPGVTRVMRRELGRMKKDPRHRSTLSTMRELVVDHMHFWLGEPREDVLGIVPLGEIGAAVSGLLATRFGADRERGLDVCEEEAMRLCGVESTRGWSRGERLWWRRWSPLILVLPGVESWPAADRSKLVDVVRAKGGKHESEFVRLCDGLPRLRRALLGLAGFADRPNPRRSG